MYREDLHIHSTFSDGVNTPENIVKCAIEKGLRRVGISDHSYVEFDKVGCLDPEKINDYKDTLRLLKEQYRDKIEVLCGIEQDYYSAFPAEGFDYIIGSVHYVCKDGHYIVIDDNKKQLQNDVNEYYGGDWYALCEDYFATIADIVQKTNCDVIGHFDIISKFNEQMHFFDEHHPRYIKAWQNAALELLKYDRIFEINTGCVSRGYRSTCYPAFEITEFISENGGRFTMSSDSHDMSMLCYDFRIVQLSAYNNGIPLVHVKIK